MSAELALLNPNQMQAAIDYAERLAYSGLIPDVYQGKPANVLWAMEYGRTLGLSTIAIINGVNVIKGKPTASAALISALTRQAGHRMRIGFNAATMTGWAEIVRADDPEFTFRSEWDLERAVEAELCFIKDGKPFAVDSKGNSLPWKKFYPSMVKARAITEVAREACEEVLFGLHYTPQELGGEVDEDGSPIFARVPESPVQAVPAAQIDDAEIVPEDPAVFWETDEGKKLLTRLHTVMAAKYGPMSDEQRHAGFTKFCRRTITSAKQMLPDEVRHLIGVLEKLPDFQPAGESQAPASEQDAADTIEARLRERIGVATEAAEIDAVVQQAQEYLTVGQLGQVHVSEVQEAAAIRRQDLAQPVGAAA